MSPRAKRIIFYSLVVVFLLLSPVLIAKSIGYSINFSRIRFEKMGGIFIKSKTPRLSIFLDGAFVKETSYFSGGALLTEIKPGMHILRIEKADYRPWYKTITVEPMLVTDLRNILLVPSPLNAATTTADEFGAIERALKEAVTTTTALTDQYQKMGVSTSPAPPYTLDKKGNLLGRTATSSRVVASHVHSFETIREVIYFIGNNGFLARVQPDGKTIETLGHPGFYLVDRPIEFTASKNGHIIMRDSSGGIFIFSDNRGVSTVTGGVRFLLLDEHHEKMLLVQEDNIDLFWLKDNQFQPFQKENSRETLLEAPMPIRNAVWFYGDNAHVIIQSRDGLYFLEIDGRGGRNIVELISGRVDDVVTTPELPNVIFFQQGKVWKTIRL